MLRVEQLMRRVVCLRQNCLELQVRWILHELRLHVCHQELFHLKSLDFQVLMKVQFAQ